MNMDATTWLTHVCFMFCFARNPALGALLGRKQWALGALMLRTPHAHGCCSVGDAATYDDPIGHLGLEVLWTLVV